jgi:hypothetical protein
MFCDGIQDEMFSIIQGILDASPRFRRVPINRNAPSKSIKRLMELLYSVYEGKFSEYTGINSQAIKDLAGNWGAIKLSVISAMQLGTDVATIDDFIYTQGTGISPWVNVLCRPTGPMQSSDFIQQVATWYAGIYPMLEKWNPVVDIHPISSLNRLLRTFSAFAIANKFSTLRFTDNIKAWFIEYIEQTYGIILYPVAYNEPRPLPACIKSGIEINPLSIKETREKLK